MATPLVGRSGRLWDRTPAPGRDGLLLAVANSKMRRSDVMAPSFVDASFSCTGDRFACVDDRGRVFVFFLRDNKFEQLRPLGVPASTVQFSARNPGEVAIGLCDSAVVVFNTDSHAQLCTLRKHKRSIRALSFHRGGAPVLLSASEDCAVLWDTQSWTRLRSLGMGAGIVSASFVGAEDLIAVAFRDDQIMLWDTASFELRGRLTVPDEGLRLRQMAVSDDGEFLAASGAAEPAVYVWNLRAQVLLHRVGLGAVVPSIAQLQLLPGGKSAVVLGGDGKLVVSNVTSQACQVLLQLSHAHVISAVAVNPRGSHVVALTGEAAALVYDLRAARRSVRRARERREARSAEDDDVASAVRRLDQNADPNTPRGQGGGLKPVFQLAQATDAERAVTRTRLQRLLQASGEFPSRYRALIWKFLLQLPENRRAFEQLRGHGVHPAFAQLQSTYPIQNQHLFGKLQTVLSAIAHWAPVFGEVPYLPPMAFPFVKVLEGDMLAAFETVVSLLLHWAGSWLETFPHPPLRVLGQIESMLTEAEPELARHLASLGLGAHEYGWALLRSLFTEVLRKDDWLALVDHIFAFAATPGLLLACVVAYLRLFRSALLAGRRREDVEGFLHTQHPVDVRELTRTALDLRRRFATLLRRAVAVEASASGEGEDAGEDDQQEDREFVDTPWPLPVGSYPAFARYPKTVVDFQIQERQRLAAEEIEIARKRDLLKSLEVQSVKLLREAEATKAHQAELQRAEQARRAEALQRAQKLRAEQARLDEEVRLRRLEQLAKLEENAQLSLAQQMALREAEARRVTDDIQRAMDEEEYKLQQRRENEALMNVEFQSYQRLAEVQRSHSEAAFMQRVEEELTARQRQAAVEDKVRQEEWAREDDERRAALRLRRQRQEQLLQVNEAMRSKRNVDMAWATASLERESKLSALEHERRMRLLADQEMQATVEDADAERRAQELRAKEEAQALEAMLDTDREWRAEQATLRARMLDEERRRHELEAEMQRARLDEAERAARRADFEARLRSHREQLKQQTAEEEKEIQRALFKLENERQARRKEELERSMRAAELRESGGVESGGMAAAPVPPVPPAPPTEDEMERERLRQTAERREREMQDQHRAFLARLSPAGAPGSGSGSGSSVPAARRSGRAARRRLQESSSESDGGEDEDIARMARDVLTKHQGHRARAGRGEAAELSSESSD